MGGKNCRDLLRPGERSFGRAVETWINKSLSCEFLTFFTSLDLSYKPLKSRSFL